MHLVHQDRRLRRILFQHPSLISPKISNKIKFCKVATFTFPNNKQWKLKRSEEMRRTFYWDENGTNLFHPTLHVKLSLRKVNSHNYNAALLVFQFLQICPN